MPYVARDKRAGLDRLVEAILGYFEGIDESDRDGQLNYLFAKVLKSLYAPSYLNYERVMGLLECIQHEFYRRWVSVYEDGKIREHGDI